MERRMVEAAGQDGAHVMSKEEFLAELEACLSDLSKEEQEEALAYYQDYLEEAGDEPDVLGRLGTPQQVADGIRMGLEQDVDAGEFTESGYRDGRLEEAAKTPDRYTVLMKKESAQGSEKSSKDHGAEEETEKGNGNSWSRERFESFGRQARQTWEEAKQDGFGKRAKQAWNDAKTGEWGAQAENAWKEVKGRAARSGKDNEKTAQTTAVRKEQPWHFICDSADSVRNSGGGRDPWNRFFICCSDLWRIAWNLRRTVRPGCSSICSSNRRGSIGSGHDRGRHR
ncbi:MAG: DUF1700 domain-containing protein [Lachnospiraceae bacterium]